MGFALAEECASRGAEVTLISGPVQLKTAHPGIQRLNVESAEEMHRLALENFPSADITILCAAVADYKPIHYSATKIKREAGKACLLELTPNPDIAAALGTIKQNGQMLIGFALETDHAQAHAEEKLKKKKLDFIVINSLQDEGAGFQGDTNKITILDAAGNVKTFPLKSKKEVARDIVDETMVPSFLVMK